VTNDEYQPTSIHQPPTVRPAQNGGITNVVHQMRAERSRLAIMRLSFALLFAVCALALVWVMPWFGAGLTFDNYSTAAAGAVLLCTMSGVGALAFILVWGPTFRNEPLPEFLRVLFGSRQLIRGRHQFYSRLAAECKRARKDRRYIFSVIMVQRAPGSEQHDWLEPAQEQDVAAMILRGIVRGEDVVATSPSALWVLITGAAEQARERVAARVAQSLLEFDEPLGLTGARAMGSATFGDDGDSPELLLFTMKQRLRPLADFEETYAPPAPVAAPRSAAASRS
jgi:hypothetical protein